MLRMGGVYAYKQAAAKLVQLLKYYSYEEAGKVLGQAIVREFSLRDWPRPDVITFVPMPKRRERFRGGNHGETLARICALEMHIPIQNLLRRKKRRNTQQAKLNREQRLTNLVGGFEAVTALNGERILLIDDVVTTGATVRECAKTLLEAGARQVMVFAACLAV